MSRRLQNVDTRVRYTGNCSYATPYQTMFSIMACSLSIKEVKAARLQSAGNFSLKVAGIVTMNLRKGELRKDVGSLVVPKLASLADLETTVIRKYIEEVTSMTALIAPGSFSSVERVHKTQFYFIINISEANRTK